MIHGGTIILRVTKARPRGYGGEGTRRETPNSWLQMAPTHNNDFDHYCAGKSPDTVRVRCLEHVWSNYKYFKAGARKRSVLLRTQRHYGVSSSCIQIQHAPLALPSNLQYSTGTQSSPVNCFVLHLTDLETVDVA